MLLFTKFKCTWLTAISMSLSCCINCQDVCVQQSHATKRLLPSYKVNLCRFVAMLLLRNKDQPWNNQLETFAIRLCRQRKRHVWTASSSLHDTITVNLTLVQCDVSFIPVNKLPLQESNQLIWIKMPTSDFSRNIWFLNPNFQGENARLVPPRTPVRSLSILCQVPQTRLAHLLKRRNVFD